MMVINISTDKLFDYIVRQISVFFPDDRYHDIKKNIFGFALDRLEYCFSHVKLKYFFESGKPCFNYLHGDQYAMFLYILSNTLYLEGKERTAEKLFLLNKLLFSIDVFYSIKLPEIFYFSHPLGTVLGNAKYGNYLAVYQGVTVGSDRGLGGESGIYPTIGSECILLANSTVIGKCTIGDNVVLSAGSYLRNQCIDENKIVFGRSPANSIKSNKKINKQHYFCDV